MSAPSSALTAAEIGLGLIARDSFYARPLTQHEAAELLAELERLRAIECRATEVRDSWRNGHRPEIGEDQEAVAFYILGEAT